LRKALLLTVVLISWLSASSQYNLTIQVNDFSGGGDIYLSSSLNNWSLGDEKFKLTRVNYFRTEIELNQLAPGEYTFRLSRGNSASVETNENGTKEVTRTIYLHSDSTVIFDVAGWKDQFHNEVLQSDKNRLRKILEKAFTFLNTDFDSSYKYALQLYTLSPRLNDPELKAYATNLEGEVLARLGDTSKALERFNAGLAIRQSLNDSGGIVFLQYQIGNLYLNIHDTLHAVQHFRAGLSVIPDYMNLHPFHEVICNMYCGIGRQFLQSGNLDSARWYAALGANVGDKSSPHVSLFMGDIAKSEGLYIVSTQQYHDAIRLALAREQDIVMQAYWQLSKLNEKFGANDSTIIYARNAFNTALKIHHSKMVDAAGAQLIGLFKKTGQADSINLYQQTLIRWYQLQLKAEKEREALNTYFSSKMQEQELKAQAKRSQTKIWLILLIAGIALLIAFIIRYRISLKTDFHRKMSKVEMRALRAQMNPHFIFNSLASINRYIVKSDVKTASGYLTKFSKLIRLILDNSASDHISLDDEIETLQLYLDMEALRFDHEFDYEIIKDEKLDAFNVQLPSMLIQPYVENAIWHGLLQKEEKGKLWVRFRQINDRLLQVEIEDNGIGRQKAGELKSKELVKKKSYGMQISSDRIQLINSQYQLNNSVAIHDLTDANGNAGGTLIILQIPIT